VIYYFTSKYVIICYDKKKRIMAFYKIVDIL